MIRCGLLNLMSKSQCEILNNIILIDSETCTEIVARCNQFSYYVVQKDFLCGDDAFPDRDQGLCIFRKTVLVLGRQD